MYVCYSRSKNESHAKAVLYHLENWGFTMPEEDGEKNIMREVTYEQECESIARHQEAVVVLTPQLIQDITALVELDILKSSFEKGRIKIVVFLYGVESSTLPQRLSWLGKAQLVRVTGMESVFEGMCHAVAVRIEKELFKQGDFNSCKKKFYAFLARDAYLKRIFREYTSLEAYAAGTKIVLIYAMYCYIEMRYTTRITEPFYGNCIRKLYENVDYYTQWGTLQLRIAERSLFLSICHMKEIPEEKAV